MEKKEKPMRWRAMLLATCLVIGTVGCTVEKTEEGRMPDVDIDVEDGNLPKYDVDAPDVDVTVRDRVIKVPDVDIDVDTERRTVPVPDVDVHPADDNENDDPNS
jgi:hypothetical protein